MTPGVNLIPEPIRRARMVASRLRAWGAAWIACALVCAAVAGVLFSRHTTRVARQESERRDLEARRAQLEAQAAGAGQTLADLSRRLSIADTVRNHPDWSALLRAVAARRSEGITFERLEIAPASPPAKAATGASAAPADRFALRLRGVSDSQPTLWSFVRALESLRLFESVKTVNSAARDVAGSQVIEFTIECALSPRRARPAAPAEKPAAASASTGGEQ